MSLSVAARVTDGLHVAAADELVVDLARGGERRQHVLAQVLVLERPLDVRLHLLDLLSPWHSVLSLSAPQSSRPLPPPFPRQTASRGTTTLVPPYPRGAMGTAMEGLTRFVLRRRWFVLAAWLAVLVVGSRGLRPLDLLTNRFTLPGTDTARAEADPRGPLRRQVGRLVHRRRARAGRPSGGAAGGRGPGAGGDRRPPTARVVGAQPVGTDLVTAQIVSELEPADAKRRVGRMRAATRRGKRKPSGRSRGAGSRVPPSRVRYRDAPVERPDQRHEASGAAAPPPGRRHGGRGSRSRPAGGRLRAHQPGHRRRSREIRPPSIGTAANESTSSRRGSSPVVSTSTATKRAPRRARPVTTARSSSCRATPRWTRHRAGRPPSAPLG